MAGLRVRPLDLASERDRTMWDDFVAGHPDGTAFHRTAWGQAVADGCGQRPQYLVAERGTDAVGVLPLIHVRSPLFGQGLIASGFAVLGGFADTGILATGRAANAVLVDRNPLADLRVLRDPAAVIINANFRDRAQLRQMLEDVAARYGRK